jgi:divalent metal cation (Fe/Co/Zn/Cd) transporter
MGYIEIILETFRKAFAESGVAVVTVLTVLIMTALLSLYEYAVYRNVSHRAFYNRMFNICIAVMPSLIGTIILCLQSNIVITLGTIGALAILRFRTAVKDPVDMLYLLWSVHIGITCGTQLYVVAILTSVVVTLLLLVFTNVQIGKKPFVAVIRSASKDQEEEILNAVKSVTNAYRVKSRNYTKTGADYVIELSVRNPSDLTAKLNTLNLDKYSVIEYDSEDII